MSPILGVWSPTRRKLLRRVHDRLTRTTGCELVRYEPSRIDANEVVADITPDLFLSRAYSVDTARSRVEFSLRRTDPQYWMGWWEPEIGRGFGWHQDETEPADGPVHLQIGHEDGTTERRKAAHVPDEHPYRTFERRFAQLAEVIEDLGWD